jgi:hypothetical protein
MDGKGGRLTGRALLSAGSREKPSSASTCATSASFRPAYKVGIDNDGLMTWDQKVLRQEAGGLRPSW